MTAADPVPELVAAAAEARSAERHLVAAADALPFADAAFDLVVAYNVLMDLEDVPAALREARRVLRPTGRLVLSLVHPFVDRGQFEGEGDDAPFVVRGGYFGRTRFEGSEERDGLRMDWAGWSQPLESYAAALEDAGFAIASLREPRPDPDDSPARMRRWSRLPLFLWITARPWPEAP